MRRGTSARGPSSCRSRRGGAASPFSAAPSTPCSRRVRAGSSSSRSPSRRTRRSRPDPAGRGASSPPTRGSRIALVERVYRQSTVVFLVAAAFFALTTMTYLEGNTLHPERGGASSFARYAFDELVSFVAGWAVLLDYLIVMAIGSFAVSRYLAAFWAPFRQFPLDDITVTAVMAFVAWSNVRGGSVRRLGRVIRLGLVNLALITVIIVIGLITKFHPGQVVDTIHLGSTPDWSDLWFATVLATVAFLGIEAASGLAGELQVSRSGLKRLSLFAFASPLILLVGLSAV